MRGSRSKTRYNVYLLDKFISVSPPIAVKQRYTYRGFFVKENSGFAVCFSIFCQRCRRQFLIPFFFFFCHFYIDASDFFFSIMKHTGKEGDQELLAERRIYGESWPVKMWREGGELIVARSERNTVAKVLANGH